MATHLRRDLENLKKEVLAMGGMVEEATERAVTALLERRADLAESVMAGDDIIDQHELRLEDECLKMLALHQPVAGDLRFIVAIMKVNNDLERVGDLALNLAERSLSIEELPDTEGLQVIQEMGNRTRQLLRQSLDALVNQDAHLALQVCQDDAQVDRLHRRAFETLQELMARDPSKIRVAVQLLSISRYLERIGDHATNIAEDVVFMVRGDVIRHQPRTISDR